MMLGKHAQTALEIISLETDMMGFLISVQMPKESRPRLYATVANSYEDAKVLVGNYCSITNETLRLEKLLAEGEIKWLGLQPGDVKLYAI